MKIVYVIHGSDNDGTLGAFNRKSDALDNAIAYVGDNAVIDGDDSCWHFNVYGDRRNASIQLIPLDVELTVPHA